MQTTDCRLQTVRLFNRIVLPFPSFRANRKQANRSVISANLSYIQAANWSDVQVNWIDVNQLLLRQCGS